MAVGATVGLETGVAVATGDETGVPVDTGVGVDVDVEVAVAVAVADGDELGDCVGDGVGVPDGDAVGEAAGSVQTASKGLTAVVLVTVVTDGAANVGSTSPPPIIITVPVGDT